VFESYDQKQGPHHGLPVSTPYVTKDHLQVKIILDISWKLLVVYRFQALFFSGGGLGVGEGWIKSNNALSLSVQKAKRYVK